MRLSVNKGRKSFAFYAALLHYYLKALFGRLSMYRFINHEENLLRPPLKKCFPREWIGSVHVGLNWTNAHSVCFLAMRAVFNNLELLKVINELQELYVLP